MIDNPILVVQIGSLGGLSSRTIFDLCGIKQNREYILFNNYGPPFLSQVIPGERQLVFVSHNDDSDAFECARQVKGKNPKAIVFAFVSEPPEMEHESKVDAFIATNKMTETDPSDIVHDFIEGVERADLVEAIEGFGE